MKIYFSVLVLIMLATGCSNRILLEQSSLQKGQTVVVSLSTGNSVSGTIVSMNDKSVVVVDERQKAWRVQREYIESIHGPEPVFDRNNQLISEKEIELAERDKNRWRFTVSGAIISLGTCFFVSNMLSRTTDEEGRKPIIYGGTAAGTALGTWFFYRLGAKKDRRTAIDLIRQERADRNLAEEILKEQEKREQVEKQLESMKNRMDDDQ
jgi:hypothetical protein